MSDERVPPHSVEAETAALGSMLLDCWAVIPEVRRRRLNPDSMYVPAHRTILTAALAMYDQREAIDLTTMKDRLAGAGQLDQVGGARYLETLVDATPTTAHAEYYWDIVRQKWILRQMIALCREIEMEAYRAERGDELMKQVPTRFMGIIDEVVTVRDNKTVMAEIIQMWRDIKDGKRTAGLPVQFPRLQETLGGLCPGLIIIAGRPAEGKTTFEDNISTYVASQGHPVGRITMDMTQERLLARALCRVGGVSLPKLKKGHAGESNLAKLAQAAEVLSEYKMWINQDDRDLSSMATWARAMYMRNGMKLLTVDYVQQVEDATATAYTSEHQIITKVSRVFKRLSNELKIPVLLVSQLNRETERSQRRPRLSDLRGSGSLEQDASVVINVYREPLIPKEWDKEEKGGAGKRPTWAEVAKHQDGETGAIEFWFHQNYFMFEETEPGMFEPIVEEFEAEREATKRAKRKPRQKKEDAPEKVAEPEAEPERTLEQAEIDEINEGFEFKPEGPRGSPAKEG